MFLNKIYTVHQKWFERKKCTYIFQFNPLMSGSCNIKYIMVSINLKINYWVYAHTFTYSQIHQYILQQTCN